MMKNLVFYGTFIFLFILEGCIEAPKTNRKSSANNKVTNTPSSANNPTFASDEKIYWFSATKTTGTITINKNNQNVFYLRGENVHNFLKSKDSLGTYYYNRQFCLIGKFSNTTYKEFRIRAIPITTTSSTATTSTMERMLRLDFPVESDNSTACSKNLYQVSTQVTTIFDATKTAFSLGNTCTTCNGKLTTAAVNLYMLPSSGSTQLNSIETKILSTTDLQVQIDYSSNSTSESANCTNSSCGAKGFDCCIEGQCVKDSSLKTSAATDPQYAQAMAEYTANPLSFINWPNIFNVCTNINHNASNTNTTPTTPPLTTAQERVNAYIKSWYCMEDVSTGVGYSRCLGTSVSGSLAAYDEVRYKLAVACGCTASQSTMDVKCLNWTVKPLYKNNTETDANIIDFYCYTPIPPNPVGTITNSNISVSSRSAPHRFFSTTNVNYDDIAKLSSTIKEEGPDDFYYLDETNKVSPVSSSFNYKSILGTMAVDLSRTAPAKMVDIELGKTYILTATSGYFTPCPLCARDSWFQSFFSRPSSERGTGLKYSGYTTARDAFGNNDTYGNYEDTHFGRACFLPLTMIPLTHQKNEDVQTQRLNRLKTQSAFFINGYQRDWYGFNQGALIGSFDGVTWFGIGSGRRITSTSTKLFLAFNASFLDLASKSDTIVNIIPDTANNTAPNVDFDPDLNMKHPMQGTAATCQKFHQCESDAECISQLGWEYVCTDVSQFSTTWPLFDSNGNEIKNTEKSSTLFDILSATISTTYTKRCVYRGAGAPCKRDFSTFNTSGNSTFKKLLTCAPNFYCASISSNKFNDEVVRSPNELDNILFGMDTNILGRPKDYVTANKLLPSEVISSIIYTGKNGLKLKDTEAQDLGMCRPGPQLIANINSGNPESDYVRSHSNADTLKRSDYISQIGACNSQGLNFNRVLNCPKIGSDLNYLDPKTFTDLDPTLNPKFLATQQNMCGAEAKHSTTNLSAFKSIENGTLSTISSISISSFAADACLRRAGSICHTDLDCGPNIYHENIASALPLSYFGGTEAERNYWSESLVCGQAEAQPLKSAANYFDYKLSDNRCCREIGKDFTMFTQGDSTFIPDQTGTGNTTLRTGTFTHKSPTVANRYSRYSVAPSAFDTSSIDPDTASDLIPKIPFSTLNPLLIHEPSNDQWRVLNETGTSTCCGGGWIRKFADGTHTWPIGNRLSLDAANFSCLNYNSPLPNPDFMSVNQSMTYTPPTTPDNTKIVNTISYKNEYDRLCRYPFNGGCMQSIFKKNQEYAIYTPDAYDPIDYIDQSENVITGAPDFTLSPGDNLARLDTSPNADPTQGNYGFRVSPNAPYEPVPYPNQFGFGKYQNTTYLIFLESTMNTVQFYLPAFIGLSIHPGMSNLIQHIYIKYYYDQSNGQKLPKVQEITGLMASDASCLNAVGYNSPVGVPSTALDGAATSARWCITYSSATQNRPVLIARGDTADPTYANWIYAGIVIDFTPIEIYNGLKIANPGNPMYYMTKLGRLDLLGIPQISYEPIYCNNNHDNLLPGIFKSTVATPLKTRSDFASINTYTYSSLDPIEMYNSSSSVNDSENNNYGNYENRFVFQNKIDHPAIFSSKDFTCCTPLGKTPRNGVGSCCSGYSVTKNEKTTCVLPPKTDLHVYFNRYVSNEGRGADQPGGGLIDSLILDLDGDGKNDIDTNTAESNIDFMPETGEPKFKESTMQKLFALGSAYCSTGKIVIGGAFAAFRSEPMTAYVTMGGPNTPAANFPQSIIDSVIDTLSYNKEANQQGVFSQGYRWNHHYYCDN